MSKAREVVAGRRCLLLDFDGPVCAVFGGLNDRVVAEELLGVLGDAPEHIAASNDPFDVLKCADAHGGASSADVERELTRLEVVAVKSAPPTDDAAQVLETLGRRGHRIVIVSNNSEAAVRAYLEQHNLARWVVGISARNSPDTSLLKPHPYLLEQALAVHNVAPGEAVMIGDSVTDVEAARSCEVTAIAYANKAGKRARLEQLSPDAVIDRMIELV